MVTKQQVKSMIASSVQKTIEQKVTYLSSALANISYGGAVTNLLNSLSRGDSSENQYAGNLLLPKQLTIRFYINTDQSYSTMRVLAFQWADSTVPTAAGILQYVSSSNATVSPLLWLNHHKITILYDQCFALVTKSLADAQCHVISVKGDRMKAIQMSNTANVAQMYGIFLLTISDDAIASYPQISLISELRFTDA